MGWRKILEAEHRLVLEVADAADAECPHIEATGTVRKDLAGDMIGFFRYFGDGLHHPKEEALLYARCHRRGMTDDDEPLEQMIGEHEWCRGKLDGSSRTSSASTRPTGAPPRLRRAAARRTSRSLRCHVEVEEEVFFDTAQHYLTDERPSRAHRGVRGGALGRDRGGRRLLLGGPRPQALDRGGPVGLRGS